MRFFRCLLLMFGEHSLEILRFFRNFLREITFVEFDVPKTAVLTILEAVVEFIKIYFT